MKKMVLKAGVFCVALLLGFSAYALSGLNGILAVGEGDQQHLLAYGHGGKVLRSDDGENWRAIDSQASSLHAGVWKANSPHVVLAGARGKALYSTDGGKNFVGHHTGGTGNITGIVFDGTRYIAVSSAGEIATSEDGVRWDIQVVKSKVVLKGIAAANGVVVIVGHNGFIATSADGKEWHMQNSGTTEDLYSVAFSNSNFMAVGATGSVLISHNNGLHWRAVQPPEGADKLFADKVFQDGAGQGFFVAGSIGYSQYLYHFDPPSQQWRELLVSNNIIVEGVARAFGRLFVAGILTGTKFKDHAIILSSADDGGTWEIVHGGA